MSLQLLPYELLLQVLFNITDLATLGSLLQASPAAYRIFDKSSCAAEICECILATGHVCKDAKILIRLVALLRAGSRPFPPGYTQYTSWPVPPGVASFRRQVIEESLKYSSRQRTSAVGFAPRRLDRDVTPAVLRSLLVTARRITTVSVDCVAFYLKRLEDYMDEGAGVGLSLTLSQPVWTEEQRCTRTLWRLQLIFDLKQAAANGTLGWSQKELKSLEGIAAIGPAEDESLPGLQVSSSGWCWSPTSYGERFFYHARAHHDCLHPGVFHPEKHEYATVMEYIEHTRGSDIASRVNQGLWPPTALAERRDVYRQTLPLGLAPEDHSQLLYASAAMQYYETIRSGNVAAADGARYPVFLNITLLRHTGFALWSNQRLQAINSFLNKCK